MNSLRELSAFFRRQYISSLKSFPVLIDPKRITEDTYSSLSPELKEHWDLCADAFYNRLERLNTEKKEWMDMAEKGDFLKEGSRFQAKEIEKAIKDTDKPKKLYLIQFDEQLTISEARTELQKIGFVLPAFIEAVLFFQEYERSFKNLPIIVLDAYLDVEKKIKVLNTNLYCLCYQGNERGYSKIGEIEDSEFYGYAFMPQTSFLARPIQPR